MKKQISIFSFVKATILSSIFLFTFFGCSSKEIILLEETTGTPEMLHMSSMYDEANGIGIGFSGLVLYTDDGGTTWQEAEKKSACLFAMDFLDEKNCIAGGNNKAFIRTEDAGRNWIVYPTIPIVRIKSLSFRSFAKGWISSKSDIYQTLDEGVTWTSIKKPEGVAILECVYMVEDGCGFICSSEGIIYETNDNGNSWQERTKIFTMGDGIFEIAGNQGMQQVAITFKENVGYIECIGIDTKQANVLKTFKSLDNGATWKEVQTVALNKRPVAVNICMTNLISLTNDDRTMTVFKFKD